MDDCAPWVPPATFELAGGDGRTIRYCAHGRPDGLPVIFHSGSPSTRWKRPAVIEAVEQSGLRMLIPDRPGYGGSTRQSGRAVASAADDARLLADAPARRSPTLRPSTVSPPRPGCGRPSSTATTAGSTTTSPSPSRGASR